MFFFGEYGDSTVYWSSNVSRRTLLRAKERLSNRICANVQNVRPKLHSAALPCTVGKYLKS